MSPCTAEAASGKRAGFLQLQKHFTITHWEKGSEEDCWQWVFRGGEGLSA
ncbi:MAG: hypothetical protein ACLTSZ_18605 [Lachnospiraceae bacterium]